MNFGPVGFYAAPAMLPGPPVEALKNIGPKRAAWLRAVGIATRADLERVGPVFADLLLRHRFSGAGLNLLMVYALHGALTGEVYRALSPQTRQALRVEVASATCGVTFRPAA